MLKDFVYKNIRKIVFLFTYHLPCSFKIFKSVFAFLYMLTLDASGAGGQP